MVSNQATAALGTESQGLGVVSLSSEFCFNVAMEGPVTERDMSILRWLFAETFEPGQTGTESSLAEAGGGVVVEVRFKTKKTTTSILKMAAQGSSMLFHQNDTTNSSKYKAISPVNI